MFLNNNNKNFSGMMKLCSAGAVPITTFGKGVGPVHFSYFYCSGSENTLLSCTYYTYLSCYYSYHAGVKCEGNRKKTNTKYSLIKEFYQLLVQMEMFV